MSPDNAIVLVDFDGTLMDSTTDLVELTCRTLDRWGLEVPSAEVEGLLGLPTDERLRRHGMSADQLESSAAYFRSLHAQCRYERSQPMAGSERWLAQTPHWTKWIVSASPESAVLSGLKHHGLDRQFERVIAAPLEGGLDKVVALAPYRRRLAARCCWVLGDQQSDFEAAASVGARFALMRNLRNEALTPLADRMLTSFEELFDTPLENTWKPSPSSRRR